MFLIESDGELVGRANLSSIIHGAFQSASVGYLVDEDHTAPDYLRIQGRWQTHDLFQLINHAAR